MEITLNEKTKGKPYRTVKVDNLGVCFEFLFALRFDESDATLQALKVSALGVPCFVTPEELADAQNLATLAVYRLLKVAKG